MLSFADRTTPPVHLLTVHFNRFVSFLGVRPLKRTQTYIYIFTFEFIYIPANQVLRCAGHSGAWTLCAPALCLCYFAFQVLGWPDGHIQHCHNSSGLEPDVSERPVNASSCILPPSCVLLPHPSGMLCPLQFSQIYTVYCPKAPSPSRGSPRSMPPSRCHCAQRTALTGPSFIKPSLDRPSKGQTLALMEALCSTPRSAPLYALSHWPQLLYPQPVAWLGALN